MNKLPYQISIAKCAQYDPQQLTAAIEASLAPLGGLAHFIDPGDRVLLKLNLLSPAAPERAVTTHPEVVRAVIRLVQGCGAMPVVGDSPGGMSTRTSFNYLLQVCGIRQVLEETGCESVLFDEEKTEVASEQARVFKRLPVARAPLQADKVICLPKLKTHQYMTYTGAVKLLYGYLPGITKVEYHLHAGKDHATFADLLLDIYETFPPTLTIMDAIVGMEGQGPSHGSPRQIGLILAGDNCAALDFVVTEIIGLPPAGVPTIAGAIKRGIGPASLDEVMLHGPALADIRVPDFVLPPAHHEGSTPAWVKKIIGSFAVKPVIDKAACVKCGKCAENCPPKAITFVLGAPPTINYDACLRCFCCQELCPPGAVRVPTPRFHLPAGISDVYYKVTECMERLKKK